MSNKLFALSDLHISLARPKPMDVFGPQWTDHHLRIREAWLRLVDEDDVVLLPGDLSWAMDLDGAGQDLEFTAALPGIKVLLRGNHDYWWKAISKVRRAWGERLHFIQNDALQLPGLVIGGSRLWQLPYVAWGETPIGRQAEPSPEDEKIAAREVERFKLSLAAMGPSDGRLRVVMTHFPPLGVQGEPNPVTRLLTDHRIDICVFGHLHDLNDDLGGPAGRPWERTVDGVRYLLTSCDHLEFQPALVADIAGAV